MEIKEFLTQICTNMV